MLWLALHLPLLSLEAFGATLAPAARARPAALIAENVVCAVNAAAAARGLRPGIRRATALALAADLLLAESDTTRDAAALQAVVHAALAFTPMVALQDGQTVLLEVQASLRLFGGLAALRQQLLDALAPLGHRVQMAAAPTALGSALLAQWAPAGRGDLVLGAQATHLPALQALLDAAPVGLLGAGREHQEALQGMGLNTLAELRALPRGGLARRFGEGLLDEFDRACGRKPDPRLALEPTPTFDSRLELHARADNAAQLLHAGALLLARLLAWARARQARVAGFTLRMLHERHRDAPVPATELHVALAEPSLDPAHLQLLLRERLARLTLAAPTLELQLHCSRLATGAAPNGELFPSAAGAAEGLLRLLERLRARLGDDQVLRLVAVADHRPERASCAVPALGGGHAGGPGGVQGGAKEGPPAPSALPLHRPAWLLPTPQPLAEREAQPLFEGRPLQLLSGPERIETGWWDGDLAVRDYFIAQAADGALLWVYRGRLSADAVGLAASAAAANWFLQGRFG
ncbi:UmuC domain-containing protein [Rubrivivax sp. A210]|uniref:Y-family DNA polymerase n=1 Tax=Rubrivivax sp. A210 TaxID=2772301 RepID=UPI0019185829|nr:DNA polymerase Y family protein [Rubrivivax sp. A210]CAD5372891.1 UmuC domain-containing protein [Rubrivivax sp. A210]